MNKRVLTLSYTFDPVHIVWMIFGLVLSWFLAGWTGVLINVVSNLRPHSRWRKTFTKKIPL